MIDADRAGANGLEVMVGKALMELADDFDADVDWSDGRSGYGDNSAYEACARRVREVADRLVPMIAIEWARMAALTERRADDTELAFERLRDAADKVGHQAACPVDPCDCWMAALIPLLDDRPQPVRWVQVAEHEQGSGADVWSVGVFIEAACSHVWLDRPESDTAVCELCGAEQ